MTPLRICELFAGIGATAQGLRDLGIPFESTVCEIDSKAYRAYCAVHGDTPNLGDITKVDRLPEAGLVTWTYPCISCSVAGKREGMVEGSGTASSLAWEVIRLLRSAKAAGEPLPPVLLMENVPAILHKRNLPEFERLVSVLSGIGYESSYRILNACDYGVPQSRKRCFMVSVLRSHGGLGSFQWPEPCPDGRVLKDVLEPPEDVPGRTRPEGRPRAARGRAREVLPLREPSRRADEEHGEAALQGQRLRLQAEGSRRHRVLGDDAGRLAQDGQLRLRADGDAGRQGARVHQEDLLPDRAVAHRGDRLGRRAHPQGGAAGPFRGPLSEALASRMPPPPGLPRRRLPRDQGPRALGHRPVQARGELHRGAVPDGYLQEPEGRGAAPTEETPGSMGLERGYIPATYTEDYGNLPRNPFDRTEHNKE